MYPFSFLGAPALAEAELAAEEISNKLDEEKNVVTCTLCTTVVNDVVQMLENGTYTDQQIVDYIINVCVNLNIFANPDQVCGGMAAIALVSLKSLLF